MTFKCLSSGSIGNCYLLECNNEILILDCGISIKDIRIGLNFDLSKVVGCVVTHSHKDHSKSVDDLKCMGIDVWQPYLDEKKIQRRYFGGFSITSFDVPHDDTDCCGFLIECQNGGKLLYATDFEFIKYSFKKMRVQHLLIECNYQKEYVNEEAENKSHILRGHAELRTTLNIVRDNSDSLKTVILCHLSQNNANPTECVAEVQKIVNPTVYVDYARKNFEIELS